VHAPQVGKAITKSYLTAAFHVFFNPTVRYVREFMSDREAVLEFLADHGVHVAEEGEHFREVRHRPLDRPGDACRVTFWMQGEFDHVAPFHRREDVQVHPHLGGGPGIGDLDAAAPDVLVALDVFDPQFAGSEPHIEVRPGRDLNGDLEAVGRSIRVDPGVGSAHLGAGDDARQVVLIANAPRHANPIVGAVRDPVLAGRQIHVDPAVGDEVPLQRARGARVLGGLDRRRGDQGDSGDRGRKDGSHVS
jgi:hypothetical protein